MKKILFALLCAAAALSLAGCSDNEETPQSKPAPNYPGERNPQAMNSVTIHGEEYDIETTTILDLRQYRTIIVERSRRQIFRQIVQIERRQAGACQARFVQDGGKDASKRRQSPKGGNCAVLP